MLTIEILSKINLWVTTPNVIGYRLLIYFLLKIFLYVKTRHCKCYTLNIMHIKLCKLSWIRNKQNPRKLDPHEINKLYPTVQTITDNTIKHKCTL